MLRIMILYIYTHSQSSWLIAIYLLCVHFSPLKLGESFIQSLYENVHLFSLHSNGCSSGEVGTGVAVIMGTPVAESMCSNGLFSTRCNHSVQTKEDIR